MSLRSQTMSAIIVLLVALGAIFLLVGSGDVPTEVSLPESVVSATPEPTSAPTAAASADVWILDETAEEERWTYTDEAGIVANIIPVSMDMEVFATRYQIEPPAEDAPIPVLAALQRLHDSLVIQLGITPDGPITFDDPVIRLFGGVPVAVMRLQIPEGSMADFPVGLDYAFALLDQGDDQVSFISYGREAEPNDEVYGLFETWLEAHVPELAQPAAAATDEAESAGTEEPEAVGTEEAEAVSTEEPETAVTEEVGAAVTEEPEVVSTEEPEAVGTEEAEAAGTEEAISVAPAERWVEVGPGQFLYSGSADDVAQVIYRIMSLDEFVAQTGLQVPAADVEEPLLDVLTQIRGVLEAQAVQQGLTLSADQVEGPEMRDVNGVPAAFLRVQIPPAGGDPTTALDLALIVFDLGEGQVNGLQYVLQGEADEAVFADFMAWVDANMDLLTTIPAEAPAATEEATAEAGE